jgi:hypothetical protein
MQKRICMHAWDHCFDFGKSKKWGYIIVVVVVCCVTYQWGRCKSRSACTNTNESQDKTTGSSLSSAHMLISFWHIRACMHQKLK